MLHVSRFASAYLIVVSAAKEASDNAPQRSDDGAFIAFFQAAVAAFRNRRYSWQWSCALASTPSPTTVTIANAEIASSLMVVLLKHDRVLAVLLIKCGGYATHDSRVPANEQNAGVPPLCEDGILTDPTRPDVAKEPATR